MPLIQSTAEVGDVLPSGDSVTPIIIIFIIIFSLSLRQCSKHQIYQLSSAWSSAAPRLWHHLSQETSEQWWWRIPLWWQAGKWSDVLSLTSHSQTSPCSRLPQMQTAQMQTAKLDHAVNNSVVKFGRLQLLCFVFCLCFNSLAIVMWFLPPFLVSVSCDLTFVSHLCPPKDSTPKCPTWLMPTFKYTMCNERYWMDTT